MTFARDVQMLTSRIDELELKIEEMQKQLDRFIERISLEKRIDAIEQKMAAKTPQKPQRKKAGR